MADIFPGGRRPMPDELFSSWLTGTALNHGMTLNALTMNLYNDCNFIRRDIDKFADIHIINRLANVTDTRPEEAQRTSLYLRALPISSFEMDVNSAQWVTHVNNIYTTRHAYGMCFCPLCLKEDNDPYYRTDWRLSFVCICLNHRCLLLHKCQRCRQEINLYRISATFKKPTQCWRCGADIRKAKCLKSECFEGYYKVQSYLIDLLNKAHEGGRYEHSKVREYFLSLYYYCYMISHQAYKLENRYVSIYQELSELMKQSETYLYFDSYEPFVRLIVLELAFKLYEKDVRCNFKLHAQLYSANNGRRKQLVKPIPCGRWCEDHDYLKISRSCRRFIAEAMA